MKIYRNLVVFFTLLALSMPLSVSADSLTLYAAGSLKAALGDVAASYEKAYQTKVTTKFGPSGLLRKAIEGGENPDVFASANMAPVGTVKHEQHGFLLSGGFCLRFGEIGQPGETGCSSSPRGAIQNKAGQQ